MLILHLTGSPGFSFEILHLEPLLGRMNMMMLEKNCASFIWLPAHLSFLTSACIPCCLTVCFTSGHMQPFVCSSFWQFCCPSGILRLKSFTGRCPGLGSSVPLLLPSHDFGDQSIQTERSCNETSGQVSYILGGTYCASTIFISDVQAILLLPSRSRDGECCGDNGSWPILPHHGSSKVRESERHGM